MLFICCLCWYVMNLIETFQIYSLTKFKNACSRAKLPNRDAFARFSVYVVQKNKQSGVKSVCMSVCESVTACLRYAFPRVSQNYMSHEQQIWYIHWINEPDIFFSEWYLKNFYKTAKLCGQNNKTFELCGQKHLLCR